MTPKRPTRSIVRTFPDNLVVQRSLDTVPKPPNVHNQHGSRMIASIQPTLACQSFQLQPPLAISANRENLFHKVGDHRRHSLYRTDSDNFNWSNQTSSLQFPDPRTIERQQPANLNTHQTSNRGSSFLRHNRQTRIRVEARTHPTSMSEGKVHAHSMLHRRAIMRRSHWIRQ